jgi:integrase
MAWLKYRGTPARGSFHAYWSERVGKKRRKPSRSLRTRDEAEARRLLGAIETNLRLRGVGLPEVAELAELREKYLGLLAADGAAASYTARVRIVFGHFERHYPGIRVSEITADLLDEYKVKRRADGVSGSTINWEVTALRAAVRRGRRWRYQVNDLSDVGQVKVAEKPKQHYSAAEVELILATAHERERTVALLGLFAGLRRGEMLQLRWRDVDFELNKITLGDGWLTKTRDARALPLEPALLKPHLMKMHYEAVGRGAGGPDDLVLEWTTSPQNLTGKFIAYLRAAGILQGSIHWLRHTFITRLEQLNVGRAKTQRIVGHKKSTTTDGYTHMEIEDLRPAIAALSAAKYELNPVAVGDKQGVK